MFPGVSTKLSGALGPSRLIRPCAGAAFGMSKRFWLNLQASYDLVVQKERLGDRLMTEVTVRAKQKPQGRPGRLDWRMRARFVRIKVTCLFGKGLANVIAVAVESVPNAAGAGASFHG